jgi:RNA polymerase sigma-70 factor, ECF subfamily
VESTYSRRQTVSKHAEDLQLVERMLAGDERAFTAFGDRYFQPLYRFTLCRLGGDRERTRDIVQTAITKALGKLATYRGDAALLTWLCACCRNEILMVFRSRRSAPAEVELGDEVVPAEGFAAGGRRDPEATLLRAESGHLVHMTLDLLPAHYARALEWKYVDGLSVEEIAGRLGVRAKAAESLLTRAREAFRDSYSSVQLAAGESPATEGGAADGVAHAGREHGRARADA